MLIFLYGPDTYRSKQKLNEIIEKYKEVHKKGWSLNFLDGQKIDFEDLKNEIFSISMFQEKKLIVLENSFANVKFKDDFLENSKKILKSDNIIIFYENDGIEKSAEKDPLFKFLKKEAKSQEFNLLSDYQLKNWAKKEFGKYKCKIEERALDKLIEFVGNDLWRFSNEIKKLASFKSTINEKDIELMVKPKIETDIFKTIDFLAAKNKKKALELIKKHLAKGDSPLYLFSMINFQFRNLLLVKSTELNRDYRMHPLVLSKKLEVHPYVVQKATQQARNFTFEELKKIYQKIFQADLDIKTGKIEAETALDMLIVEI